MPESQSDLHWIHRFSAVLAKGSKFKDKTSFLTLNLCNGPTTLNLVRDNKHGRIRKPCARIGLHYACPC